MTAVILNMGWPAAVVLVVFIIALVVTYGIRTAARQETERFTRERIPVRGTALTIDHDGD